MNSDDIEILRTIVKVIFVAINVVFWSSLFVVVFFGFSTIPAPMMVAFFVAYLGFHFLRRRFA